MTEYDPQAIEQKWQARWNADRAFEVDADPAKPKYYVLEMLPYPSGTLHMGHMRNYTIGDVVARYRRMQGFTCCIRWAGTRLDCRRKMRPSSGEFIRANGPTRISNRSSACASGLDSATTGGGKSPRASRNITAGTSGFSCACWNADIAYRKRSRVNWCPKCATVLANEQVVNGCCWRHEDTPVEAKEIEQWFLRITQYADELLESLDQLEGGWPERVLTMQRNWIGKSQGTRVRFAVDGLEKASIEVFTTRVDTIYGASALILAPEHPVAGTLVAGVKGSGGD